MKYYLITIPLLIGTAFSVEPKSVEDCLKATVTITAFDSMDKEFRSYGSGFLVNEDNSTYLYTNAHVIQGCDNFQFIDHSGKQITDILWIESFAEPFGASGGVSSGDGIRFRLRQTRELALSIKKDWSGIGIGTKVIVFGDNEGADDGHQRIEILEGKITGYKNGILNYNCPTEGGSSGGAVVDAKTFEVIALNTWGVKLPDEFFKRVLEVAEGQGFAFGTLLRNAIWDKFKVADYLRQDTAIRRMRYNLELMILLSYLRPTGFGIFHKPKEPFVDGTNVGAAIEKHKNDRLLGKLLDLSQTLGEKGEKNHKTSNVDIYKIYITSLESILREHSLVVPMVSQKNLSFYYREYLHKRSLDKAAGDYSRGLSLCVAWFKQKIGVGGRYALGEWETLPPLGPQLAKEVAEKYLKN